MTTHKLLQGWPLGGGFPGQQLLEHLHPHVSVEPQHRKQGAQVQHEVEGDGVGRDGDEVLPEYEMTGGADRRGFGQALHRAEQRGAQHSFIADSLGIGVRWLRLCQWLGGLRVVRWRRFGTRDQTHLVAQNTSRILEIEALLKARHRALAPDRAVASSTLSSPTKDGTGATGSAVAGPSLRWSRHSTASVTLHNV